MSSVQARYALRIALAALLLTLSACAVRPYAGVGIAGPSWGYGPVRIGTGANIGIAVPPIHR